MMSSNTPYRDEATLRELYHGEGMSLRDIADKFDTNHVTIIKWMDKHGIERRDRIEAAKEGSKVNRCFMRTQEDMGYERWHCGMYNDTFKVHRLAAIAWFGVESVKDKVVHHENNIPWDNREDNITVMDRREHTSMHNSKDSNWTF